VKRRRRGAGAPAVGRAKRGQRRQSGAAWGGGRVIHLTAARRREAARRRAAAIGRPVTTRRGRAGGAAAGGAAARGAGGRAAAGGPAAAATIDFHLAACVACARAGGRVVLDHWQRRGSFVVREKGRNDFVTQADRAAEDAIVRIVRSRFPDHAIVAEESSPEGGRGGGSGGGAAAAGGAGAGAASAGYRWYIDPLDGTTNYIHGYPLFGVSVGLADAQGMRAAAVFDPVRDEMFTAARGQGAFLNGRPIRVTRPGKLQSALVVTGIPFRSLDRLEEYLKTFRAFIAGSAGIRRDGSAALDLAYVACGRYDGFWEMGLSSWDVAAGSLLVGEAGGVVTDFHGRAGYVDSGDIAAASPDIHPAMLRIIRDAYGR
jgi:myo-inositol-1(or 4)-monophosphatase